MGYKRKSQSRLLRIVLMSLILVGLMVLTVSDAKAQNPNAPDTTVAQPDPVQIQPGICTAGNTITAKVVAFDQVIFYNRFGSFDPGGMMFALKQDVVAINSNSTPGPGNAQLKGTKRPRPIVLRVHEGECLQVTFTNWLDPSRPHVENLKFLNQPDDRPYFNKKPFFMPIEPNPPFEPDTTVLRAPAGQRVKVIDTSQSPPEVVDDGKVKLSQNDTPATRSASMHVNGLDLVNSILSDGSNVGKNASSLVPPGGTIVYTWYAAKQGQYLLYSTAATSGGEGDGGQVVHGLFGSVNVEPPGSKWYRSQITAKQLIDASQGNRTPFGQPVITNYDITDPATGLPILNILKGNEIVYTDLNAIITDPTGVLKEDCTSAPPSSTCGVPFREFTVIFHDELETGAPAFPELHQFVFHSVRDGFAINYGSSGLGSELLANRKKVGPTANCEDCKYEEFFLESWTNGDPALLVKYSAPDPTTFVAKAIAALFPDDPSNVHHSYINDRVRFRNVHAGPKETHVFHLHAHQWLQSPRDQESTYLDSQTISPGAAFTYEINYGGSGNRNLTPGDAIFHCHLYPHFAQGMWELWRNHDVYEAGTDDRNLPDGEIAAGTPTPAVVPVPFFFLKRDDGTTAAAGMPLMPTPQFPGYPFYIAAHKDSTGKIVGGKRPPQPPLAFDSDPAGGERDGGLRRHVVVDGTTIDGPAAIAPVPAADPVKQRVETLNPDPNFTQFARILEKAEVDFFPPDGTVDEKKAEDFHKGVFHPAGGTKTPFRTEYFWPAIAYSSFTATGSAGAVYLVNGRAPIKGAPYADPCPDVFKGNNGQIRIVPTRSYRAAWVQGDLVINNANWHDRQARVAMLETEAKQAYYNGFQLGTDPLFFRANSGDCVDYRVTNLIPNFLNLDDFQIYQITDIIGQHIHLVKFDVTSSDGAGNGWNYESGAFSPTEVQQRIRAIRKSNGCNGALSGDSRDGTLICPVPKINPFFGAGIDKDGDGVADLIGAQTLVERWWADPLLNTLNEDRTIRTVFTHDHFSPSGHQHHGLYAGLVIEPMDSTWKMLDGGVIGGRPDGGPTSFAAIIQTPDPKVSYREFNLEIGDFAIVYRQKDGTNVAREDIPVNPPNHVEHDLPIVIGSPDPAHPELHPTPEAISAADPGTMVINYKNEPIPLRIGHFDPLQNQWVQNVGKEGEMAYVFSSDIHKDPFTPILNAYVGDRVQIRLLQGAQEEQHVMNVHGNRWLFEPGTPRPFEPVVGKPPKNSGYTNAQAIGISEHFEFDLADRVLPIINEKGIADFLYQSAPVDDLWNGMWGILRAHRFSDPALAEVPSNPLKASSGNVLGAAKEADLPLNPLAATDTATSGQMVSVPAETKTPTNGRLNRCPIFQGGPLIRQHTVKAFLATDLLANLPDGGKGIIYNKRFNTYDNGGIVFIKGEDEAAIRAGTKPIEPLVLRFNKGECVEVTLQNRLPKEFTKNVDYDSWNSVPPIIPEFNFNQIAMSLRVSLHMQLIGYEVSGSDGSAVGFNPDTTVGPGEDITYAWFMGKISYVPGGRPLEPDEFSQPGPAGPIIFTPIEFGVTHTRDVGDVIKHASHGLVGALVVEPQGSTYTIVNDPANSNLVNSNSMVDVFNSEGKLLFREFVMQYQDDVTMRDGSRRQFPNPPLFDPPMKNMREIDDAEDSGQKAFNYKHEPLFFRLGLPVDTPLKKQGSQLGLNDFDFSPTLSSVNANIGCGGACGDPATPVFTATAGTPVRFRVLQAAGHARQHGYTVFGHHWNFEPWQNNSKRLGPNPFTFEIGSYSGIGPTRHLNILTTAGGAFRIAGDYLYRTQESFKFTSGMWGLFRVKPQNTP